MSKYTRLPRIKQKKTDEFVSLVDHAVKFVVRNKKSAVLIALFVVGMSLVYFYAGKKRESHLASLNEKIYLANQSENREESLKKLIREEEEWLVGWSLFQEYLKEGKKTEAYAQLKLMENKIPSYLKPLIVWNKASLLWEEGKGAEALADLEKTGGASSLFKDDLLFLKGEVLVSLGKKKEAKKLFEELAADSSERDPVIRKKAGQRVVLLGEQ